jgi:hypothetical protein
MRRAKYPAGARDGQAELIGLVLRVLPLVDYGRLVKATLLARVMAYVAATSSSLSQAASQLRLAVGDETLRQAWRASLPNEEQLLAFLQASLLPWRKRLRRASRKRGFDIAIDVHHRPYYGQACADTVRGQAKQGTKRFWSVATAALVFGGQRLTLALLPVTTNRLEEVLAALWIQLKTLGIHPRRLLLDRGFYGAKVVTWLQQHRLPFVMPMIRRGRPPRGRRPGTGTAPFFQRGRRGFTSYTWRQRKGGPQVTVQVAIVPHCDRRRRPLVYLYGGHMPSLTYCQQLYRRRFGIESSYRQARQARAWTTSREPRWRRLLIVLSFVLRNRWLSHSAATREHPRSQPLTFRLFLHALQRTLENSLPTIPGPTTCALG